MEKFFVLVFANLQYLLYALFIFMLTFSSSFGPILSSDVEWSCWKPVYSVIIESRQTKCPICKVIQGTEASM